jgi:hypothetical protein
MLVTIAVVLASLHSCLEMLGHSSFSFTHSNELLKTFPTFQQADGAPFVQFGITVVLKGFLGDLRVERWQPSATGRLEPFG